MLVISKPESDTMFQAVHFATSKLCKKQCFSPSIKNAFTLLHIFIQLCITLTQADVILHL